MDVQTEETSESGNLNPPPVPESKPTRVRQSNPAALQRRMTMAHVRLNPHLTQESDDDTEERSRRLAPITREDVDMAFDVLSKDGKRIKREDIKFFADYCFSSLQAEGGRIIMGAPHSAGGLPRAYSPGAPSMPAERGGTGGGTKGDNASKAKAFKFVTSGKEELTREGLTNLLLNRALASMPFDEAFQVGFSRIPVISDQGGSHRIEIKWFDPHGDAAFPALNEGDLARIAAALSPYGMPHKGDVEALLRRFDGDGDGLIGVEDFKRMII